MNNDLDVIVKKYPNTKEWNTIRVYALGDVHVGAPNFDERAIEKKIDIIKKDKYAAVVLCGDLADYGLRNSKTNIYQATMSVREQQPELQYLELTATFEIGTRRINRIMNYHTIQI